MTSVIADPLKVSDLEIGSKITNYLTSKQIEEHYRYDMEKNSKGEEIWGKNKKYSAVAMMITGNIFDDDYEFIQIYYQNSNDKIVAISGGLELIIYPNV